MYDVRESWTDERLDDFAAHVDQRFDAVDKRFDEVDRRFDKVERRMEDGFSRLNNRFDAMQHTMMAVGGGVIVALLGIVATQL